MHVPVVTESSALGAALCAGVGAGIWSGLGDLGPDLRQRAATFEPDPGAVASYDDRYQAWLTIYRRMPAGPASSPGCPPAASPSC